VTSVAVTGLCKAFGSQVVLRGLDLEVADGSLTAVLGPSGSGKTTLLRILAGFERADEGTVALGGTVVADDRTHVPPERRHIGYVPQDGALFPHLSAADNIAFGLPRGERRGHRVEVLLELVGLAGQGQRFPHELSGGQQQRVAVARALATRPGLVLLDEPFSSLDAAMRAEVREDVARVLRETGSTALLVTHDQDEALSLADEVAVLRDGLVAQRGTPEVLYSNPLDPAMARFVGDANLLVGELRGGEAETALGRLPVQGRGGAALEAGRAVVLVRPEQLALDLGAGEGIRATVVASQYFGHDMVVTLDAGGGAGRLRARLSSAAPLAVGTEVAVQVTGPVSAWPAADTEATPSA
jgi:iron(III) transport system ATP-binding protein